MLNKTIDSRDKKKDLRGLLDILENVADSIETIESTLYDLKSQISDEIKCAKYIFSKAEEEARILRNKRAGDFSLLLDGKISEEGLFSLELINRRLDLINHFVGPKLLEDFLYDGLLFYFKENYEKALEAYDSAIKMTPENAETWFNRGIVFVEMGQLENAVKAFEKALEINPDFTEAWHQVCISLLKVGKYENALNYFEHFSEQKLGDAEIWLYKGEIQLEIGQKENAIKAFDKALELRPDFERARYLKGRVLFDLEKYDRALEVFNFLEENEDPEIWLFKGKTLLKKGEYESAIKYFDRCLEIKSEDIRALYLKIECLDNINSCKSYGAETRIANDVCEKSSKVEESETISVDETEGKPIKVANEESSEVKFSEIEKMGINFLANIEEDKLKDPEESIESLERWYEKGLEFVEKKQYDKALESLNKALEIDPESSFDWEIKGKTFLKLGHHEKALEAFNFALNKGVHYADLYSVNCTVLDTLNKYENLLDRHEEGIFSRGHREITDNSCFSTRNYVIEKILQYEKVSTLKESPSEAFQEPEVSGNEPVQSLSPTEKVEEDKARKKKLCEDIPPEVEVDRVRQETIVRISGRETEAITEEACGKSEAIGGDKSCDEAHESTPEEISDGIPEEPLNETFDENVGDRIVPEKLISDLRYVITNLEYFRNDLGYLQDERELYSTVLQIIGILDCDVDSEEIFGSFVRDENKKEFDIEAAESYILSIVDELSSLIQLLKFSRDVDEGAVSSTLKDIVGFRVEDFLKGPESDLSDELENLGPLLEIRSLEDIVNRLKTDPPFSEFPEGNKEILVGSGVREIQFLFENVCRLSLINPLITAIIGKNGSGKTHFLKNLEYDSGLKNRARFVLTYELKDGIPDSPAEIIDYIYSHENFRKLLSGYRPEFGESQTNESKIHEINDLIDSLGEQRNEKFSMCLGVDGIDAYFRESSLKYVANSNKMDEEITGLLGTFKMLLECINNVCVIFALNPENYVKVWDIARADQTLRRRIVIPNGIDGKAVEFDQLNEKEAYELVSRFVGRWLERNGVDRKSIIGNMDTWPFEQNAVKLAWKVAPLAGGLIFALRETLNEKLKLEIASFEALNISEIDVASVLFRNKENTCFSGTKNIWNEIEILVRENEIKTKLQALQDVYIGNFHTEGVADAFEIYFRELGFVREPEKEGMVIHSKAYNEKSISIAFIEGVKISEIDSKNLGNCLLSSIAGAGLFICIGDTETDKINWDIDYEKFFKNYERNINYVSTVGWRSISRSDALNIINLGKIDPEERKLFVEYLDRKLGYRQYLESLEFTEASDYNNSLSGD